MKEEKYHRPSEYWINNIRPAGIEIYGEKQWMDWELLINTMTQTYDWSHPSYNVSNKWDLGFLDIYNMKEVNWKVLDSEDVLRISHLLPPEIHVYKLLMV